MSWLVFHLSPLWYGTCRNLVCQAQLLALFNFSEALPLSLSIWPVKTVFLACTPLVILDGLCHRLTRSDAAVSVIQFFRLVFLTYRLHIWCPKMCLHFRNLLSHHLIGTTHPLVSSNFLGYVHSTCRLDNWCPSWFSHFWEFLLNRHIIFFTRICSERKTLLSIWF